MARPIMEEARKESEGCWLREESGLWLGAMLFLGVYTGGFFGFNCVRCCVDGHWAIGGVLLAGTLAGLGLAVGCVKEIARRRKERKG